jgi:apolipoprotein N-acyltransferase
MVMLFAKVDNQSSSSQAAAKFSLPSLQALGAALISGLLLAAVFPKWDLTFLLPVGLVPLFWALRGQSLKHAFWLGMAAGLAHFSMLLYWIVYVTNVYGGLPLPLGVGVLLLLAGYLSLYRGLWAVGLAFAQKRELNLLWFAPALWTALELGQTHILFGGFPWELLGYSLYRFPLFLQVADLTGVYGISFLIVLINTAFYLFLFPRQGGWSLHRSRPLAVIALVLLVWLGYGYYRLGGLAKQISASPKLKVAVVQGNLKQGDKWNPQIVKDTLERYRRLTSQVQGAQLFIWPETAAPFFFRPPSDLSQHLEAIARESRGRLLFGSMAFEKNPSGQKFFNAAYLLDLQGKEAGRYDKNHLVPFGEYVPLQSLLFFIPKMVPMIGDFTTGPVGATLPLPEGKVGPLICFESIFPGLSRAQVQNGAQLLVNITNDAWFGTTSAPYQHLAMAVLRAVENRVSLARAANTGVSAFIGPDGRILWSSDLFVEAAHSLEIPWLPGGSFYSRYGDVFAWVCVLLAVLGLSRCLFRRSRAS